MKTTSKTLFSLCAMILLTLASNASANLVSNGGFENFLADWQVMHSSNGGSFGTGPAHSGDHALLAYTTGFATTPGSLSQNLSTVAGASYDLSFFMRVDSSNPNPADALFGPLLNPSAEFQVFWGGIMIYDTTNPPASYTQFNLGNLLATSASTQLQFTFNTGNGFSFLLDDISVEQATGQSVPDNFSTLWLALPLAGMMGFAQLRRKTA